MILMNKLLRITIVITVLLLMVAIWMPDAYIRERLGETAGLIAFAGWLGFIATLTTKSDY